MSSGDNQRMDIDADEQELQRNCKEESAVSEIPNLAISDPSGDSFTNEKNLSPLTAQLVQSLYSEELAIQLEATEMICGLFFDPPDPLCDEIIKSGAVPRFVHFLEDSRYPELQIESAMVLTNITCGNSAQTQVVIDAGAVPVLSRLLLSSPNENVLEHSIWALGNIARHSTESRDLLLNSYVLPPLLGLFNDNASLSLRRTVAWALRTLCYSKPPPNFEQVSQCLPLLARLMDSQDAVILSEACWALSHLSDGPIEQIEIVVDSGVCPRAIQLLSHTSTDVVEPALSLVGKIATGTDVQTQVLIKANVVPALGSLLSHETESIVKNACWTLSNIMAGEHDIQEHIQAVIDAKLLPSLIECLHHGAASVRKEAAWAISNATDQSEEQIACLVDAGAIEPFCQLLTETDSDLITAVLIGLEMILRTGESFAKQAGSTVNPYATYVKKFDGLEKLTLLSSHNDPKIKEKASTIMENYLSTAFVK